MFARTNAVLVWNARHRGRVTEIVSEQELEEREGRRPDEPGPSSTSAQQQSDEQTTTNDDFPRRSRLSRIAHCIRNKCHCVWIRKSEKKQPSSAMDRRYRMQADIDPARLNEHVEGIRYLKDLIIVSACSLKKIAREVLSCDWESFQDKPKRGSMRNVNQGYFERPVYLAPEWTQDANEATISSFVLEAKKERQEGDLTLYRTADNEFVCLRPVRNLDARQGITHLKLLRARKDENMKVFWQHSIGDLNARRRGRTQLHLCWRSEKFDHRESRIDHHS